MRWTTHEWMDSIDRRETKTVSSFFRHIREVGLLVRRHQHPWFSTAFSPANAGERCGDRGQGSCGGSFAVDFKRREATTCILAVLAFSTVTAILAR
ncbi:hypothetical protein MRB53_041137 [Persea americana]|nr:hypothetical protein MRB53_041137 [Persea americana]